MDILIKLSQFLLSLSLLIILHELGHFIPAKLFKTRVEKFYLFFDVKFSLFKKKIGDTVYGIGWLPLGGYVKISGMVDESMDTDQLAGEPQPWEFRSKPAWQRLIIMLGGVTVNFILAFVIYIGMAYAYGESYIANKDVKSGIWVQNPILEDAGLKTGDKVLKVDGKEIVKFNSLPEAILMGKDIEVERAGVVEHVQLPVDFLGQITENKGNGFIGLRIPFIVAGFGENSINEGTLMVKDIVKSINGVETPFFDMVSNVLEENKGKTVAVVVNRDGKDTTVDVKVNQEGKIETYYAPALPFDNLQKLGLYEISREQYSLAEAIPAGLHMGKDRIMSYFGQLKKIVQPETGAYKGVGGFKAIYDIFPQFWSWQVFWSITAMLSIMLGVMNLLPIPALDGGHVIFLLYEMISGRKPSDKFLGNAQMVGFFILIALLLFANGNDIYKAIFN
ncbi:RIP metalloprotease RseP [Myroides odoratimimus]|uniref:Zinc metalloprotease n=2 Tax=Myroides odoratimimus TaxID=76832 RepID=A0A0S7E8Q0_9FLAO|nr:MULTISPECIES: RIP metalloprotease RseP [Myroides]AJA68221.1 RIP metalloprotease RseP [Myroides sp. A21]ALU25521.1 RIP metalloprotease RseP [Myroides odoratimimus]APA91546.1 RIP metalloprotease RseP [Myroides sp. ZB35]EHO10932.1 RIP metalloprotease RseP [Myroides odoratimimus CCUG 10230]EHO15244.1 RIP metalloprotease RseP [Myroides odoratimimus CCUG 12901]